MHCFEPYSAEKKKKVASGEICAMVRAYTSEDGDGVDDDEDLDDDRPKTEL